MLNKMYEIRTKYVACYAKIPEQNHYGYFDPSLSYRIFYYMQLVTLHNTLNCGFAN